MLHPLRAARGLFVPKPSTWPRGQGPSPPPANGRPPSRQNLRKRLRQHYGRTAAASTLRRTLGCLLAGDLGLQLRQVGSSGRRTNFGRDGEQKLSDWMADNAFVSWVVRAQPWELERELIQARDLPLNLRGNERNPFYPLLAQSGLTALPKLASRLRHGRNSEAMSAWESDRSGSMTALTWATDVRLVTVIDPVTPGLMARQWPISLVDLDAGPISLSQRQPPRDA